MTDHLKNIKEALEAGPTDGPWTYHSESGSSCSAIVAVGSFVGEFIDPPNDVTGQYIAACNPFAIRSILERLEKAEMDRDALKQTLHDEIDSNHRLRELGGAKPDEDMTAFLERVIVDAGRYRVLRSRKFEFVVEQDRPGWRITMPVGKGLDDAIDAAIASQQTEPRDPLWVESKPGELGEQVTVGIERRQKALDALTRENERMGLGYDNPATGGS